MTPPKCEIGFDSASVDASRIVFAKPALIPNPSPAKLVEGKRSDGDAMVHCLLKSVRPEPQTPDDIAPSSVLRSVTET